MFKSLQIQNVLSDTLYYTKQCSNAIGNYYHHHLAEYPVRKTSLFANDFIKSIEYLLDQHQNTTTT